jgi:hypothetical protein
MDFDRIDVGGREGLLAIVDPVDMQIVLEGKLGRTKLCNEPVDVYAHVIDRHDLCPRNCRRRYMDGGGVLLHKSFGIA